MKLQNYQPSFVFCDIDTEIINTLKNYFASVKEIDFKVGDLLESASNVVISPANSYGFMDGGIDKDYVSFFGDGLQQKVLERVRRRPEGYLSVGASELIHTGHKKIPYLILAPTMIHPEMIPAYNVFRAFRAALKCIRDHKLNYPIYTPGFGTGVGGVEPDESARMMFEAYNAVFEKKKR